LTNNLKFFKFSFKINFFNLKKNDPLIDGQEPILFKIGELGERYWTWF